VLIFVSGEPGSGKTTYVDNQRSSGDLVWDMDHVADVIKAQARYPRADHELHVLRTMRDAFIRSIGTHTAWVIVSSHEEAKRLARDHRIVDCKHIVMQGNGSTQAQE